MELKMEVYDAALTLLGILETYDAVIIDDRAFQPGSFSLESIADSTTVPLLRPGHIIWLEGQTTGVIECVQAESSGAGQTLSVRGCLLAGLLGRRILWGMYNLSGSPPQLMYDIVQDCAIMPTRGDAAQRVIPNLVLDGAPPADARTVRKQSTGASLTSFLTELAQANQVAYGVRFDPAAPQMAFWARVGVDRTVGQSAVDPVFYSTELDDVLASEYAFDSSDYRNIVLVSGEREGDARKNVVVYDKSEDIGLPSGYTPLEYIESMVKQYINTGFLPSNNTRMTFVFQPTTKGGQALFGCRTRWNLEVYQIIWSQDGYYTSGYNTEATQTFHVSDDDFFAKSAIEKIAETTIILGQSQSYQNVPFQCTNPLYLFGLNNNGSVQYPASIRLYSCVISENSVVLLDLVPCKNPDGMIGLYNTVTGVFYGNAGTDDFIAGPVIAGNSPSGLERREMFVDARDLQSDTGLEPPMSDAEYEEMLCTRGKERLAENQLVQSFSTTIRMIDPTYQYGVDFWLGDTITVTDERLGITINAVVEGVERSVGKSGEDMVLTLGYGLPTLSDRLRKAGV